MRQLNKYQSAFVNEPTANQWEFLERCQVPGSETMLGYGIAAGGSTAIMLAALGMLDVPGSCSVILNFGMSNAKTQFMERVSRLLKNSQPRKLSFIAENGATLVFDNCVSETDCFKFAGMEINLLGFDHLERFRQKDYDFIRSRLCSPAITVCNARQLSVSITGDKTNFNRAKWIRGYFADKIVKSTLRDNPNVNYDAIRKSLMNMHSLDAYRLEFGEESPSSKECEAEYREWRIANATE